MDETCWPSEECPDFCPPEPPSWDLWQVQALVRLQGGMLQPGQFRFLLQDEVGRIAARGCSNSRGQVSFSFVIPPWSEPCRRRFVMRQQSGSCAQQQIRYDRSCFGVELCPDGRVQYSFQGRPICGVPVFTNTVTCPGFAIMGTVRDTCGHGLPGWKVELKQECSPSGCHRTAATDGKGRYLFDRLSPGRYIVTAASRPGWQALGCCRYVLRVDRDEQCGIDFVFQSTRLCPHECDLYPT